MYIYVGIDIFYVTIYPEKHVNKWANKYTIIYVNKLV